MKKPGYREMLRDRCPKVVNYALKWCKAKEKWIDHVYFNFIKIYAEKDQRNNATRIALGISEGNQYTFDFEKTIDNTAHLTAKLLHTYQLSVEDVKMHADFMEKVCPHRLITEGRVEEFYDLVQTYYESEGD